MRFNYGLLALFLVLTSTAVASTTWYVNGVSGSDSNNCLSPTTACKTIGHAISRAASGDSIRVAAATYKENLSISKSLTITGAAASTTIIDGGGIARVVAIPDLNTVVKLSNLTLRNGHAAYGAGILNYGELSLNGVTLTGNAVSSTSFFGDSGGAVSNMYPATLTVSNSTISQNTVRSSLNASLGGGIVNSGTLTVSNSTIRGNTVQGVGYNGGVNHSRGGGISSSGTLRINNSTISANQVFVGTGGGIYSSGTLAINNSTIGANSASSGGGVSITGTTTLQNSIVTDSAGGNCAGSIVSHGYNLSSDDTCAFTGPGDMNNTNPMLGPLQNNGGPTQTMALSSGSPAIDAGNPSGCRDSNGNLLKTDQRGKPRPDMEDTGGCDMGAYESQSVASGPVLTGYCAAPSYPRCAVALDLTHCPPGRPAAGVLSNECGKYSAWSLCQTPVGEGKCLIQ